MRKRSKSLQLSDTPHIRERVGNIPELIMEEEEEPVKKKKSRSLSIVERPSFLSKSSSRKGSKQLNKQGLTEEEQVAIYLIYSVTLSRSAYQYHTINKF